ncbi:MAG: hypothetical protein P1P90_02220 [Patescibacteria group bacterium]|nr:hypothetical protein [Patescibacteria group bacterium]
MANRKHSRKFTVTNGPDKFNIMLALFDNDKEMRSVNFTIECNGQYTLEVIVYRVMRYSGGENEWIVTCHDDSGNDYEIGYCASTHQGELWVKEENFKCEICGKVEFPWDEPHPHPGEECAWCHMFIYDTEKKHKTADGYTICQKCWDKDAKGPKIAQQRRRCELEEDEEDFECDESAWDNEDPLEGAVDPVGGYPDKDKPIYSRDGTLIGHVPIEEPDYDNEGYEEDLYEKELELAGDIPSD